MNKQVLLTAGANTCSAMGRETISKNRVTSRKTTGVGVNFVRRFAAAIFCLALALNLAAQTSGTTGDCTWTLTGSGSNLTLTISGTGAMADYSYNNMPWNSQKANIKTVVINNGVTTIGNYAFDDCSGLTSVTIGNSVTTIGNYAFDDCSGLTSVTIGNSVTTIGNYAFYGCSGLTSVTIGSSVTTIDTLAFANCSGLTSVTIPNSVTTIGNYAFASCRGLTSVTIGSSVTTIEPGAFSSCTGLTSVTIPNSVTTIGHSAFAYCSGLTSVTIPNSVTTIANSAFSSCTGLTLVTIPNSVTTIGNYAFAYCSGLTSVTIPNSVTTIANSAFYGCNLSDIVVSSGNFFYKLANNVGSGKMVIPYTDNGFNGNNIVGYLVCGNVTIPNSVTTIEQRAFYDCRGLTSVTIPESVTTIESGAFSGCSGLTSVTIPESVTTIESGAFSGCSGLTSVTIPNSVTSIDHSVFSGCTSLKELIIKDGNNTLGLGTSTIPSSSPSPFRDCPLETVYLGRNISYNTSYNSSPFYQKTTIKEVVIGNSVTTIGNSDFYGCSGLTSITIGSSVTTIGNSAFVGCNLSDIVVSSGNFFYKLANNVGSGKMVIPYTDNGFNGNNIVGDLVCGNVTIPNSVTTIERLAFYGCTSLKELTIADGNNTLDLGTSNIAFHNCPLETVYLGRNISYDTSNIGNSNPFYQKTTIKEVVIGNSVTAIGDYAFDGCSGLTDVTVNWATPLSIYSGVFSGVTISNVNLHIPSNKYDLYASANVWKDFNLVRELVPQTITFNPLPAKAYGDESFTLSASSNSGLPVVTFESNNTEVATVSDNTVMIVGAGEAVITALQAGNADYSAADNVSQTLIVNKAPLTVTVDSKTREYGEDNPNLTYTISGFKNSETQSVIDVLPDIVTTATQTSDAGSYEITVSDASDNNYDFSYQNGNLSITKAALTVTAENKSREYGEVNPNLTYSISGFKNSETQSVIDVLPNVATTAMQTSDVGSYEIAVSDASDNNYDFTYQNGNLSITKASLTVTAENKSREYGEDNPNLTYTISGFKNSETHSVIDVLPDITTAATPTSDAGSYEITVSDASDNNYDFTYQNGNLNITKAALTVTAENKSREYGEVNPNLTYSISGFKNSETQSVIDVLPDIATAATQTSDVGSYEIAVSDASDNNYDFTYQNGNLNIIKASLIVTAENKSREYGEVNPNLTYSISGFKNNETQSVINNLPSVSTLATQTSNVGNYPITASGASDNNYDFNYQNGNLSITKAALTVTAGNKTREYGEANPNLTYSISGFKNSETQSVIDNLPAVSTTATQTSDVGNYPITASGASDNNYDFNYTNGNLSITKAALSVTAENKSREYGEANPTFTLSYSGWKNGNTVSSLTAQPAITCAATAASNVGTYPINVSGGTATNYSFTCQNGTLTVGKAPLTVTAGNKTREYGDANPAFTLAYSGWKNGDAVSSLSAQPTATCTASATSNVGTYPITVSGGSATNYSFSYQSGIQTVNKATLSVLADSKQRIYGAANPQLTYSISGFKNNETQSVIDVLPAVTTTATQASNAGSYPITVQNASDNNYGFSYQNATLTVDKAPQTITFINGISIKKYGDAPFTIAQTSSGLTPSVVSSDPSKLAVAGNMAYIVGTGTFALTASQSGNINYLPAADAITTVTVSKAPLVITANDAVRDFGKANPQFTLSYSGFKNGEDEGVLDLLPTASCAANETSPAGDYAITLSGGNDNNYIYTLVNGKLTVTALSGIEDVVANQLRIFPNPAKEELFIKSDLPVKNVKIYTLSGDLLISEDNFNEKISVSALPHGVYLLKVHTDKGVAVSKIVKK